MSALPSVWPAPKKYTYLVALLILVIPCLSPSSVSFYILFIQFGPL